VGRRIKNLKKPTSSEKKSKNLANFNLTKTPVLAGFLFCIQTKKPQRPVLTIEAPD